MELRGKLLALLTLLMVCSCGSLDALLDVVEVDPMGWNSQVDLSFEVDDNFERSECSELQIMLRYDNNISADSIELWVSTTAPDGVSWSESFTLATPTSNQSINILDIPYRTNISWSQQGIYHFSLLPQRSYRGVSAVGVNVIKVEN